MGDLSSGVEQIINQATKINADYQNMLRAFSSYWSFLNNEIVEERIKSSALVRDIETIERMNFELSQQCSREAKTLDQLRVNLDSHVKLFDRLSQRLQEESKKVELVQDQYAQVLAKERTEDELNDNPKLTELQDQVESLQREVNRFIGPGFIEGNVIEKLERQIEAVKPELIRLAKKAGVNTTK